MIDTISYEHGYSAKVFDETHIDYYDMMLDAAQNNQHRRAKDYNRNILDESLFCVIHYKDNRAFNLFGVQQEPWMIEYNVARAFYREWKKTTWQEVDDKNMRDDRRDWYGTRRIFGFFEEHPEYHQKFGLENLFLTRTFYPERNQNPKAFEKTLRRFDNNFEFKGVHMYKSIPQAFYVMGDDSFLKELPKYK
jgi:hypothetical protein